MSELRGPTSEVAAAMLSPLLHRIQNTTQLLIALRSLIGRKGPGATEELGESLAEASRAAEEQGWLIGLLARSMGSDVLLAREERHALRSALRLVADWVRQSRGTFELPKAWPALSLADGAPRTAELALELLELAWRSIDPASGARLTLGRSGETVELVLEAANCERAAGLFAGTSLARCGATLQASEGSWKLRLPADWFEDEP